MDKLFSSYRKPKLTSNPAQYKSPCKQAHILYLVLQMTTISREEKGRARERTSVFSHLERLQKRRLCCGLSLIENKKIIFFTHKNISFFCATIAFLNYKNYIFFPSAIYRTLLYQSQNLFLNH